MEITLQRITLRNFKGVSEFEFKPDGQNATISGPNGSGKSTVADALIWLLFGRNQAGDSAFSIKTLDEYGLELHNLEHEVEAVLEVASGMGIHIITLRKTLTEKWTKKRGASSPEFSGHETAYYIDEVPKPKKDFDAFVSGLVREDLFRMLTSITHFNAMKWQDRRALLLEVAGNVADADVIAMDERFAEIPAIIGGRTFDDTVKMLKSRRPKLNAEIEQIGPRIDEALRSKPGEAACIPPQTGTGYAELTAKLRNLQNGRAALLAGDTSAVQNEINAKRAEIDSAASAHRQAVLDMDAQRQKALTTADRASTGAFRIDFEVKALRLESEKIAADNDKLRAEYQALRAKQAAGVACCPTCAQALPEDNGKAAEVRKGIIERLDAEVALNVSTGKSNKARIDEIGRKIEHLTDKLSALNDEASNMQGRASEMVAPAGPDMAALNAELAALTLKLTAQGSPDTAKVDEEIEVVRETIKLHDEATANNKRAGEVEARVAELKANQKSLGAELDELDRAIMLCEEFTRARVSMLESGVAEKFSPLGFKLFADQINGGIAECCETLVPSPTGSMVPWSDANTGAKIMAGLKIIEVLGRHCGISAPVFVDNAESLTTDIPEMDAQTILLVATDEHEGLAVKVEQESETAA